MGDLWDVGCVDKCRGLMRCKLCKYIRWIKRDVAVQRCLHCGGVNWPPNHPGGVALIKGKNKRLSCEPMRKH